MLLFLLVLLLLFVVAGALGFLTGWLSGKFPRPVGLALCLLFSLMALALPASSLTGYWNASHRAASEFPAAAAVLRAFVWQSAALFGTATLVTAWAVSRQPLLTFLPFPVFFVVFYSLLLPPIYTSAATETLSIELDGRGLLGLFLACASATTALGSMGLGLWERSRKDDEYSVT